jgi:hypothetical protein
MAGQGRQAEGRQVKRDYSFTSELSALLSSLPCPSTQDTRGQEEGFKPVYVNNVKVTPAEVLSYLHKVLN